MDTLAFFASWAQILALFAAIIVPIVVGVWLYRRGQQKPELTCLFTSVISPIAIRTREEVEGDIEIHYNGQPVDNLYVLRATLVNTGNLALRNTAVVEPIQFNFGDATKVLRYGIADKEPENLKVDASLQNNGVTKLVVDFELFNPNEEFSLEFVYTGEKVIPKVEARIEGIKEIKKLSQGTFNVRAEAAKRQISTSLVLLVIIIFAWVIVAVIESVFGLPIISTIDILPITEARTNATRAFSVSLISDLLILGAFAGLFMLITGGFKLVFANPNNQ